MVKRHNGPNTFGLLSRATNVCTLFQVTRVFCFLLFAGLFIGHFSDLSADARSAVTPWKAPGIESMGAQNLVYGSSSFHDVELVLGPPDHVINAGQMYPVIVNYFYFEKNPDDTIEEMASQENKAATVCVFENNLLVGLHYKTRTNQLVDITYILQNNNDYGMINHPARYSNYSSYFFNPRFYQAPYGRAW